MCSHFWATLYSYNCSCICTFCQPLANKSVSHSSHNDLTVSHIEVIMIVITVLTFHSLFYATLKTHMFHKSFPP